MLTYTWPSQIPVPLCVGMVNEPLLGENVLPPSVDTEKTIEVTMVNKGLLLIVNVTGSHNRHVGRGPRRAPFIV